MINFILKGCVYQIKDNYIQLSKYWKALFDIATLLTDNLILVFYISPCASHSLITFQKSQKNFVYINKIWPFGDLFIFKTFTPPPPSLTFLLYTCIYTLYTPPLKVFQASLSHREGRGAFCESWCQLGKLSKS